MFIAILFKRLILSIFLTILGIVVLKYTGRILRLFGLQQYLEEVSGGGGTVTMWKLIGIGLVIAAILVLGGAFSFAGF